ncbi:MAG: hypothetical protein WEA11_00140 [Acidimicrobiales bacterium]
MTDQSEESEENLGSPSLPHTPASEEFPPGKRNWFVLGPTTLLYFVMLIYIFRSQGFVQGFGFLALPLVMWLVVRRSGLRNERP